MPGSLFNLQPVGNIGLGSIMQAQNTAMAQETQRQRVQLEAQSFEIEKFYNGLKLVREMSFEDRNAALPKLNEMGSRVFGFPVKLDGNMELADEVTRQIEMVTIDKRLNPEERQKKVQGLLYMMATAGVGQVFPEVEEQAQRMGIQAAFPYTPVQGLTGQEKRDQDFIALGKFVNERVASLESVDPQTGLPRMTHEEARREARRQAEETGLFAPILSEEGRFLPLPDDDPERVLSEEIQQKERNRVAAIQALPEQERLSMFQRLVEDHLNLAPDDPKKVEARMLNRIMELGAIGPARTPVQEDELRTLLRNRGGAEELKEIDPLDQANIALKQAQVRHFQNRGELLGQQSAKLREDVLQMQSVRDLYREQVQATVEKTRAQVSALQAIPKKTQAQIDQLKSLTEKTRAEIDKVIPGQALVYEQTAAKLHADAALKEEELKARKDLLPLEKEELKVKTELLRAQGRMYDAISEFKKTGTKKAEAAIDKELALLDAKAKELESIALKNNRAGRQAQTSLDRARQSLINKREGDVALRNNTNIISSQFAGLPQERRTPQELSRLIQESGLDPGTVDTNKIITSQLGRSVNINESGLTKANVTRTQAQLQAVEGTGAFLNALTAIGSNNPQIFGVVGTARDTVINAREQVLQGFRQAFGGNDFTTEAALYPTEGIEAQEFVQKATRDFADFDPSAPRFDTLRGMLVYMVARMLDSNGRLGVDDVKRADQIVGDRGFFDTQKGFLAKMEALQRVKNTQQTLLRGQLRGLESTIPSDRPSQVQSIVDELLGPE